MTEIELQAGYLYEYMRAHLTHIKLVEYNPDRLQRVKQQGLDKIIQTLQQYADIAVRETGQKQCNNCYNDGSFCPTKSIIPCPYWKPNKLKAP